MLSASESTLRIHFNSDDLLRTRLAVGPDPMWEVVLSLHALQSRTAQGSLTEWRRHTIAAVPPEKLWRLIELAPPVGNFPDFLTPTDHDHTFGGQLDKALSTPREELSEQIRMLGEPTPFRPGVRRTNWLRGLEECSAPVLADLEESVHAYYRAGLEPYWDDIRAAIAADRTARAEQYALGGLHRLLDTLHPRIHWRPPVLEVLDLHCPDLYLDGRGLLLQPSYFCNSAPTKLFDAESRPVLVYPAERPDRGPSQTDAEVESRAEALLGRTRALALSALATGCTTSELARHCEIAVSTASHHASVLRDAGLATTRRAGPAVLHEITDLGRRVLAAQPGPAFRP